MGLCGSEPRQHFTMSLEGAQEPIELGTPEYVPLASHTLVLRTRLEVRRDLVWNKPGHPQLQISDEPFRKAVASKGRNFAR